MMKKIILLIFLIISIPAFGQETGTLLKNWKTHPVPTDEDTLYNYSLSRDNWFVYLENNEIKVDQQYNCFPKIVLPFEIKQSNSGWTNIVAPMAGLIDALKVNDGYLVGFNRGEWGGELYWFSEDGKKRYEISGHQIVKFIERDNQIYAIEGLAHLTDSQGSIIQIKKAKKKWKARKYVKLPSAPVAIQIYSNNNFIVLTSEGLLFVDGNANINTLIEIGVWDLLYPSSMIIHKNIVYIGMRKGVYKYNLVTREQEWLMPE